MDWLLWFLPSLLWIVIALFLLSGLLLSRKMELEDRKQFRRHIEDMKDAIDGLHDNSLDKEAIVREAERIMQDARRGL